jgi:hypothetical protein
MLALTFRVGEGVVVGILILATLGLLWLATATDGHCESQCHEVSTVTQ